MKFRKFAAVLAAIAVVSSASAISSFALTQDTIAPVTINVKADNAIKWDISILGGEAVKTVSVKVKVADGGGWYGGGGAFAYNVVDDSFKDNWAQADFSTDAGTLTVDSSTGLCTGTIDFEKTFEGKDLTPREEGVVMLGWWWASGDSAEIMDIEINGKSIMGITNAAEKPVETTTAAETEAPEEETTEASETDPVEGDIGVPDAEVTITLDESPVDDDFDIDAMEAANEAFVYGKDVRIDLNAALGDEWEDLALIQGVFSWTPGQNWNGGAGIGGGAVFESGDAWVSGPEYGTVNANDGNVDLGIDAFTLMDLSENGLAQINTENEDGTIAHGELQIQSWWQENPAEANVQLVALRFLDSDGETIKEYVYDEAALDALINGITSAVEDVAASEQVTTTSDVGAAVAGDTAAATVSSKGSPDTGIADVAAVAGIAVAAAGAVVLTKKRK